VPAFLIDVERYFPWSACSTRFTNVVIPKRESPIEDGKTASGY
jgi:hypothetical protein